MTSPNKNVHPTSLVIMEDITMYHAEPIMNMIHVMDGPILIPHLYLFQWKDDLTLMCVGGSGVMDGDLHFTMPLLVTMV